MPGGFREISCPDCGERLKPNGSGKYLCDNPDCPVIFLWPEHWYEGEDRIVRDAVMVNAKATDISRVAMRLER